MPSSDLILTRVQILEKQLGTEDRLSIAQTFPVMLAMSGFHYGVRTYEVRMKILESKKKFGEVVWNRLLDGFNYSAADKFYLLNGKNAVEKFIVKSKKAGHVVPEATDDISGGAS